MPKPLSRIAITTVMVLSAGCSEEPATKPPAVPPAAAWPAVLQPPPVHSSQRGRWLPADLSGLASARVEAVQSDGRQVVLHVPGQSVLYDLPTGKPLHAWLKPASALQFGQADRVLLMRRQNGFALWDADTSREFRTFTGHPQSSKKRHHGSQAVAALSRFEDLVAISNSRQLFDRRQPAAVLLFRFDGQHIATLPVRSEFSVRTLQFVAPGRLLMQIEGLHDNRFGRQFSLWTVAPAEQIREFPWDQLVKASEDGRWIGSVKVAPPASTPLARNPSIIELYNPADGQLMYEVSGPGPGLVRDFAFRPDGQKLLAPIEDRLFEWDLNTGRRIMVGDSQQLPVAAVRYSSDGRRRMITVARPNGVDDDVDHFLRIFSTATGRQLSDKDVKLHSYNGTEDLFFFPSGKRFIDRATDFSVRDSLTGAVLQQLPELRGGGTSLWTSPDRRRLLTPSLLTDLRTGKQRQWILPGLNYQFIRQGSEVFVHSNGGLFFADVETGKLVEKLRLDLHRAPTAAAAAKDGSWVASAWAFGGERGAARLILMDSLHDDQPVVLNRGADVLLPTADADRMISGSEAGIFRLRASDGEVVQKLWQPPGRILSASLAPNGRQIVVTGVEGHQDRAEPITTDNRGWAALIDLPSADARLLTGHNGPVHCADFSQDGQLVVTGSADRAARVWQSTTGKLVHTFAGHRAAVRGVAFTEDPAWVLSSAADGIAVWPLPSVKENGADSRLNPAGNVSDTGQTDPVSKQFSRHETINAWDGQRFSTATSPLFESASSSGPRHPTRSRGNWTVVHVGDTDRLLNLPTDWLKTAGTIRHVPRNEFEQVPVVPQSQRIAQSKNQKWLAWQEHSDGMTIITDTQAQEVYRLPRTGRTVKAALSDDGRMLALVQEVPRSSDEADTTGKVPSPHRFQLQLFDCRTGESKFAPQPFERYVSQLAFSADNRRLLVERHRRELQLLDTQFGQNLGTHAVPPHSAFTMTAFSANHDWLAVTSKDSLTVELLDAKNLQPVATLTQKLPVDWIQFASCGRRLLIGQKFSEHRNLLTVWDVEHRQPLWSRVGPVFPDGTFSTDGRSYLSAQDDIWSLWDLSRKSLLCVVVVDASSPANRPVFGRGQRSLRLGSAGGRLLWSHSSADTSASH